MDLKRIQESIKNLSGDGWLFCDFHNRDHLAYDILDIDKNKMSTRRWFYLIPASGEPIKLLHKIEQDRLDNLPGKEMTYSGWVELHDKLKTMLANYKKLFMQYSLMNNLPAISLVDGGTIELIRSFNIDILSSKDLVQIFKSQLNEKNMELHKETGVFVHKAKNDAFNFIFNSLKAGDTITEYDVQQFILVEFHKNNLTTDGDLPIVAVNEHAANPHFTPTPENSHIIKKGDKILIDLWARINTPAGIYYDITWCGYAGKTPPQDYKELFEIIVDARKIAKNLIRERLEKGLPLYGWEVDKACRDHIVAKGYGEYFVHRTGHSIDTVVHGSGVNLDNLETKDDRQILPGTCFSIEPGIYLNEVGVRTEINVLVDEKGRIVETGDEQETLLLFDL